MMTNVIHVTKGGDKRRSGDRIPAVWINRKLNHVYVYVCSAITYQKEEIWGTIKTNEKNFCTTTMVSLGKIYDITIQQSKKNGKYLYQIFISGKKPQSFVNLNPRKFKHVDLYTSDPWYPPFTSDLGTLSDLKIESQTAMRTTTTKRTTTTTTTTPKPTTTATTTTTTTKTKGRLLISKF